MFFKGQIILIDKPIEKIFDSKTKIKILKIEDIIFIKKKELSFSVNEVLTGIKIPAIGIKTIGENISSSTNQIPIQLFKNFFPIKVQGFCPWCQWELNEFFNYNEKLIRCSPLRDPNLLKEYCNEHQDLKEWLTTLKTFLKDNSNNPFLKNSPKTTSLEHNNNNNKKIKQLVRLSKRFPQQSKKTKVLP